MNGKQRVVCFMLGAAACLAAGCTDDPATPTPPVNVAPAPTEGGTTVSPPKAEANAPGGAVGSAVPGGAGSGEAGGGSAAAGSEAPTPPTAGTAPTEGAERPAGKPGAEAAAKQPVAPKAPSAPALPPATLPSPAKTGGAEPGGGKAVTPPTGPIEPPKASSEPEATGSAVAKPGFQTPPSPAGDGDLAPPGQASN